MTDAFPVFIGIIGKREFSPDPAKHGAMEQSVRSRIACVLDYLDKILPVTPKVLLTGGAAGSDLIAAEEVLRLKEDGSGRPSWLVLVVLPFDASLYREDFAPEQWAVLEQITRDARTRSVVLPPLRTVDGAPVPCGDLTRQGSPSAHHGDLRRRHYEQVGLWIADTSNILIAVMAADEPADRIGGTARIVACRRGARPDPVAAEVIAASTALAPRPELRRPPEGHVWLIDPTAGEPARALPISVLAPYQEEASRMRGYLAPARPFPDGGNRGRDRDEERDFHHSMAVLEIARRYSRQMRAPEAASSNDPPRAWTGDDPVAVLRAISDQLRGPGYEAAERSRYAFYCLAGLFLSATFAFALFATFLADSAIALFVYVLLVVAIMAIYSWARLGDWQPISEDRRAIREILRVQAAWWQAGLADRVDHIHLQGGDLDLARVREAARNLITWALLTCPGHPTALNWSAVLDPDDRPLFDHDMAVRTHPDDWIGSQWYYFRQREHQREAQAKLTDALSWTLFAGSAWLVTVLLICLSSHHITAALRRLAGAVVDVGAYWSALATAGCLLGTVGLLWLRGRLRDVRGERERIALSAVHGLVVGLSQAV
jgi:hypothetical protein